ncbi:hypothetical protein P9112_012027 [Eukaryota sp. TZLM1-RC]
MPLCDNCDQDVPAANFTLHKIQCQRNTTKCPHCQEPVSITSLSSHIEEQHAQTQCSCNKVLEKRQLDFHKKNECPDRPIQCKYCDIQLPLHQILQHEAECGSRSTICEECGERVRLAHLDNHLISGCSSNVVGQSPRTVSTRIDSSATRRGRSRRPVSRLVEELVPELSPMSRTEPLPSSSPVSCSFCDKSFSSEADVQHHFDTECPLNPDRLSQTTSPPPRTRTPPQFPCGFCGRLFNNDREVADHFHNECPFNPDLGSVDVTEDSPVIPCEFCGELFPFTMIEHHQMQCRRH